MLRLTGMSIVKVLMRGARGAALVLLCACSSAPDPSSAPSPVRIIRLEFVPESETFAAAVGEYERIWAADAARIVRTMQEVSGLTFTDTAVTAIVFEGVSSSGFRDTPMRLRASYPFDTKQATLIHELGHRLQSPLFRRGRRGARAAVSLAVRHVGATLRKGVRRRAGGRREAPPRPVHARLGRGPQPLGEAARGAVDAR